MKVPWSVTTALVQAAKKGSGSSHVSSAAAAMLAELAEVLGKG
jgi:hypothetical protein